MYLRLMCGAVAPPTLVNAGEVGSINAGLAVHRHGGLGLH